MGLITATCAHEALFQTCNLAEPPLNGFHRGSILAPMTIYQTHGTHHANDSSLKPLEGTRGIVVEAERI